MYANRTLHSSQSRNLYTAKTVQMSAAGVAAERAREAAAVQEWGTIEPSPQRTNSPMAGTLFDWGIALGLVGMLGGATLLAGGTVLAAGAMVLLKPDPQLVTASAYQVDLRDVNAAGNPIAVPATAAAPAQEAPVRAAARPSTKKQPRKRTRSTSPTPRSAPVPLPTSAPTTPQNGESAMSLSQLKSYLTDSEQAQQQPVGPARAPVAPPAAAPVAGYDDDLAELLAEPTPSPSGVAQAQVVSQPAPLARAPAAPAARPSNMLSSRLMKAPNGVLILDEPFDPVPIAIATDGGAAIYVDGELLGGAPLAVVLDRGSHDVVVQAEKGTVSFNLDASEGEKWCFSVKKEPKLGNCR